jgi:MFS family permease
VFYEVDFRIAFLSVLLTSVLAAILLFMLPQEKDYFGSAADVDDPNANRNARDGKDNRNEVFLYCGWLTNMLGWGLTGAVRTVYAGQVDQLVQGGRLVLLSKSLPLHVFTAQSAPAAATLYSWMQTILSLGYFVAILVMGRTVRWQHQFRLVVASEALLGAGIWVLAGSHSLFVVLICHAVMGAFAGFGYLGSQCYSAANPRLKHRRIATNEGLSASTSFALPLVFAQLGTWYGITWPFRHTPFFLVAYVGLQFLSLKYAKRRLADGGLSAREA